MAQTILLKSLKPLGLQVITSTTTATAINSTCRAADMLSVSVETAAVRYRADAAPTRSTGVYLATNSHTWFDRYRYVNSTSQIKFIGAVSTAPRITIQAWQYIAES